MSSGNPADMKLSGKRLLILGAGGMICNAVQKAHDRGIITIVADYFESSLAKQISDKAYLVSTADTDALVRLCETERIDGIFTGYSEMNLHFARELADKVNLPFYASQEQIKIFTNKANFKSICHEYHVGAIPAFSVGERPTQQELNGLDYPVIVKPVDSYSGKGITICNNNSELPVAIQTAKGVSKSDSFLVEKFMPVDQYDVITVYYTIQSGKAVLSSMVDRHMFDFPNSRRLSTVLLYPSEYTERYLREADAQVRKMLVGSGITDGTIFIEGCVDKSGFYFWEAGFRLCGAQQAVLPARINGIDVEEMLINYALTGKMAHEDLTYLEDPFFKGKKACNLLLFVDEGEMGAIEGVDRLAAIDGVINYTPLIQPGTKISPEMVGTLDQNLSRVHIVSDTWEELAEAIRKVFQSIQVFDKNGKDLLLKSVDFAQLGKPQARFAR
jgi:biotin carboxylase